MQGRVICSRNSAHGRSSHVAMDGRGGTCVSAFCGSRIIGRIRAIWCPFQWDGPANHPIALSRSARSPASCRTIGRSGRARQDAGFEGVGCTPRMLSGRSFLQDGSNNVPTTYGGSLENRTRLLFEIVSFARFRVGVRSASRSGLDRAGTWNGMSDSNPNACSRMWPVA